VHRIFDVRAPLGTLAYIAACAGGYLSQPLYVLAVAEATGRRLSADAVFWLLPFRRLTQMPDLPTPYLAGGLILSLAAAWVFAMLSFRRTGRSGGDAGFAALSIVPLLQFGAFLWFAMVPLVARDDTEPQGQAPGSGWLAATQGVLAGTGLTVFAVAVSTLVFGTYGFGLFVLSPLLVGFATGFLANRRDEALTSGVTAAWVIAATVLGAALLIVFGLEGGICMLMASPIMALPAIAGGLVGRMFVISGRDRARPMAMSLAVLPIVFAVENAAPPEAILVTHEVIEIAAPPSAVWAALVDKGEIGPAPSLPFRLGLAYPVRSEILGEGVGAERIGVFSTGAARERVTAWVPGRRLAFDVLSNPPAMRELSPYDEVRAPHTVGYFETAWTSFDLEPVGPNRTRLIERAQHRLRLDPVLYWEPMARWAIRSNNARVLAHIRRTAEASVAAAQPSP